MSNDNQISEFKSDMEVVLQHARKRKERNGDGTYLCPNCYLRFKSSRYHSRQASAFHCVNTTALRSKVLNILIPPTMNIIIPDSNTSVTPTLDTTDYVTLLPAPSNDIELPTMLSPSNPQHLRFLQRRDTPSPPVEEPQRSIFSDLALNLPTVPIDLNDIFSVTDHTDIESSTNSFSHSNPSHSRSSSVSSDDSRVRFTSNTVRYFDRRQPANRVSEDY